MRAFHADHTVPVLPPGHRFPMDKYRLLREAVAQQLPQLQLRAAEPASEGELALVHAPEYIAAVLEGWLTPAQLREIGFPWSPGMAERARRSVGATIQAARAALREGVAANLAGGTHHASAAAGGGFCVFNDIAVAARLIQAEYFRAGRGALPVAVIDLDVHQGNGTAAIFADDPSVYTLSLHGAKNFPFRKVAGDLDVDLPDGCGDADYLGALDAALARLWADHDVRHGGPPGLIFYQAGADVLATDRLGRLALTPAGVAERDRRVLAAAQERRIPLVLTMGGGYGERIEDTVAVQLQTVEIALAGWQACAAQRHAQANPGPVGAAERE
ncbi:histone deacetylase family protein [Sphaerotilus microaerophilus]|jgi:acetoin utilization deacetylase AcuC-like enzyme|uniref:Histone deacetylase n=1 Tax=Sphaerotilus microaerophilus TaxID=2914710 RepID=A0ABN6PN55_9BURK|nr:histone deacetylase [Sphaerotilus sp. FB-5]BDI06639.1 histone deacetylase [Sphaerotilus sp. FB-5]